MSSHPPIDTTTRTIAGESRTTLNRLFDNPANHHVDWNGVRELFEDIGHVKQVSNHRFELILGGAMLMFLKPHTAHLSEPEILEVRQFLRSEGWAPVDLAPRV